VGTPPAASLRSAPATISARGGRTPVPVADVTAAFSSVFVALSAALAVTYVTAPELRLWLGGRRGLVDWITLVALVAAFGVGIWAMRRSPTDAGFPLVIPIVAAWGVVDELRYFTGAVGLHGLSASGIQIRALDDVGSWLSVVSARLGPTWPYATIVLCAIASATLLAILRTRRWAERLVLVTEPRVVAYLLASVGTTIAAPLAGLYGTGSGVVFASGLLEMTGATLLVVAGLAAGDHRRIVAGWRRRLWPWLNEEGPLASIPLGDARHPYLADHGPR